MSAEATAPESPDPSPRRKARLSRRKFLAGALLLTPAALVADAAFIEPKWIKVRTLRLSDSPNPHRLVHFTDVHHKGDRAYLEKAVQKINALQPDSVCFTGDLIEDPEHLKGALEILALLKAPLYAVPGNHDYWSKVPFDGFERCCAATGGAWLMDASRLTRDGRVNISGSPCLRADLQPPPPKPGVRNVLLIHYPAWVKEAAGRKYDLILSGHSHGGQFRIPFCGALIIPYAVEQYEVGWFETPSGPMYVNPGLGWFHVPIRFNCRPEITLFCL